MKETNPIKPAHILIAESNFDGHRLYYLTLIAETAAELGAKVSVLTNFALSNSPALLELQSRFLSQIQIICTDDFSLKNLSSIALGSGATQLIVPDGDRYVYDLAKSRKWGKVDLTLLVMREFGQNKYFYGSALLGTLAKKLVIWWVRTVKNAEISVLKPSLWPGVATKRKVKDPIQLSKEVLQTNKDQAKAMMNLPKNKQIIAILGSIDNRKNPLLVAQAIIALNDENLILLLAGKVDVATYSHFEQFVQSNPRFSQNIIIRNNYLNDDDLDLTIAASDIVCVAHSNEGPSGIMTKSIILGTKIVAAGAHSLKRDLKEYPQSGIWVSLTQSAISQGISKLLVEKDLQRPKIDLSRYSQRESFSLPLLNKVS